MKTLVKFTIFVLAIGFVAVGCKPTAATTAPTKTADPVVVEDPMAAAKGDFEKLKTLCNTEIGSKQDQELVLKACPEMRRVGMEKFRLEFACDKIAAGWETYQAVTDGKGGDGEDAKANLGEAALAIHKCGHKDLLWEKLGPKGLNVVRALAAGAVDIEAEFLAYLETHKDAPLAFDGSMELANAVTTWLKDNAKVARCKDFGPYVEKVSDPVFKNFSWFWRETACKGVAPVVVKRLASTDAEVREGACKTLGEIGTKAELKAVETIAKTDAANKVEGVNTIYYVRDACLAAHGKIKLRK